MLEAGHLAFVCVCFFFFFFFNIDIFILLAFTNAKLKYPIWGEFSSKVRLRERHKSLYDICRTRNVRLVSAAYGSPPVSHWYLVHGSTGPLNN